MKHPMIAAAVTVPFAAALAVTAAAAPAAPARRTPPPASSPRIIPLPLKLTIPAPQRLCTGKTASGLGFRQLRAGTGSLPAADAMVKVNYIGYFAASGEVFDQGNGAAFPVQGVIAGFGEGARMMPRGAIYRFCIPAALGYGSVDKGPIPANSALVFQVEMLDPAHVPPQAMTAPAAN